MGKLSRGKQARKRKRPPPGLDALRHAREAIDPRQSFAMAMPSGGFMLTSGQDLIETADAMLEFHDAIEAKDNTRIRKAMARVMADAPETPAVILVTRIGSTRNAVLPPDLLTTSCSGTHPATAASRPKRTRARPMNHPRSRPTRSGRSGVSVALREHVEGGSAGRGRLAHTRQANQPRPVSSPAPMRTPARGSHHTDH